MLSIYGREDIVKFCIGETYPHLIRFWRRIILFFAVDENGARADFRNQVQFLGLQAEFGRPPSLKTIADIAIHEAEPLFGVSAGDDQSPNPIPDPLEELDSFEGALHIPVGPGCQWISCS